MELNGKREFTRKISVGPTVGSKFLYHVRAAPSWGPSLRAAAVFKGSIGGPREPWQEGAAHVGSVVPCSSLVSSAVYSVWEIGRVARRGRMHGRGSCGAQRVGMGILLGGSRARAARGVSR